MLTVHQTDLSLLHVVTVSAQPFSLWDNQLRTGGIVSRRQLLTPQMSNSVNFFVVTHCAFLFQLTTGPMRRSSGNTTVRLSK
eukprot:3725402-Rhodomonas_salina.1